jgi:hypothetical protein
MWGLWVAQPKTLMHDRGTTSGRTSRKEGDKGVLWQVIYVFAVSVFSTSISASVPNLLSSHVELFLEGKRRDHLVPSASKLLERESVNRSKGE